MHVKANGVLRGDRIELDHPVKDLPDGSLVSLVLSPRGVSINERRRLIDELCGTWSSDASLAPIFEKITKDRGDSLGRPINLDDPS